MSNCHKWLFTPRSCAVFYVPHRNQPMIRSPIPTSHGFVPRTYQTPTSSSTADQKTEFVRNFELVGTADTISDLTVPEALKWRREVCSGEERIRSYCTRLAREGGGCVADILDTHVLDNAEHTLMECCFANVQLPLYLSDVEPDGGGGRGNIVELRPGVEDAVVDWAQRTLIEEYNTFIPVFFFQRFWWVRLSGQGYLDLDDFDWAGRVLREICSRAMKIGCD